MERYMQEAAFGVQEFLKQLPGVLDTQAAELMV
jgi:hypothetical protein